VIVYLVSYSFLCERKGRMDPSSQFFHIRLILTGSEDSMVQPLCQGVLLHGKEKVMHWNS
jgi:hypothetical protein